MSEIEERHEVRVRGPDHTIVFVADSADGRLVIRQEPDGKTAREVCSITLSDPEELRAFFEGLRRVLSSLGHAPQAAAIAAPRERARAEVPPRAEDPARTDADREAVIAQARQRDAQAFAAWTKDEEQQVRRRYEHGEGIPAIARAHGRSPRAIELRLRRMGVLPGPDRPA